MLCYSLLHLPISRVTLGGWLARKKVTRKSSSSSSKVISIKSEYFSEVRTNRSQECSLPLICWHSMFATVTSIEQRRNRSVFLPARVILSLFQMILFSVLKRRHLEQEKSKYSFELAQTSFSSNYFFFQYLFEKMHHSAGSTAHISSTFIHIHPFPSTFIQSLPLGGTRGSALVCFRSP